LSDKKWRAHNPSGSNRVVVTKELPGDRWLEILAQADCKVEICTSTDILSLEEIQAAIGVQCDGAIGQLTEVWGEKLFAALKAAGGKAYSNYAVGYNNVDVDAATKQGIAGATTRVGCLCSSWGSSSGTRRWVSSAPGASVQPMPA